METVDDVAEFRDQLCEFLKERIAATGEDKLPAMDWLCRKFSESLAQSFVSFDTMNEQANAWLCWARAHKNLKIISVPIPEGILPDGVTGKLHDVKVFCHGPDDAIFNSDAEIRDKVARGNCFLQLVQDGDCSSNKTVCLIRALKKFTGGLGDDDDDESGNPNAWKIFFMKPMEEARSVICTSKINGEAGHLAAYRIKNDYYICAGSKNVHLLFRDRQDLERYSLADSRYTIAKEVCYCLLEALEGMSEQHRTSLLQYLFITRSTAVFEMLSPHHPHVEDLSYLTGNCLKFITWTSCNLQESSIDSLQLCTMPPHAAVELARMFGFDTIKYDLITPDQLEQRMSDIRQQHGIEGEVLFFLDSDHATIGMLKKKSAWYIFVRAIREKMRAACSLYRKDACNFSLGVSEQKIGKRLREIQKWLQLDDSTTNQWQELAKKCLRWCIKKLEDGSLEAENISTQFPIHWKAFLSDTGDTDVIPFVLVETS